MDKVSCWIPLANVPQSYWSRDGLSMITKTKFDEVTSCSEPIKYARVLAYSTARLPSIWIQVINCDGEREQSTFDTEYSRLPYSCKVFDHSLSQCIDRKGPEPRQSTNNQSERVRNGKSTNEHTEDTDKQHAENKYEHGRRKLCE